MGGPAEINNAHAAAAAVALPQPPAIAIGGRHAVQFRGLIHRVQILDQRPAKTGGETEYYVHYSKQDRRLDEWIPASRILPVPDGAGEDRESEEEQEVVIEEVDPALFQPAAELPPTRGKKRASTEHDVPMDLSAADPEQDREQLTKIRNIDLLLFGQHLIRPWYYSPYPTDDTPTAAAAALAAAAAAAANAPPPHRVLFVCPYCLKYIWDAPAIIWHRSHCKKRKPPGRTVYEKGKRRIYEIDGKEHKLYCQNLCLLTKLFLDHKTVYFDMEPFMFYLLTEQAPDKKDGEHLVGYFSKEKHSFGGYNLACILTLPPYQRKGYGRMLIEFSYELSKSAGKVGAPEKPLSDLGLVGYRSYWQSVLVDVFRNNAGGNGTRVSLRDLSLATCIHEDDIVDTLREMGLLQRWEGTNTICITEDLIEAHLARNKVLLERSLDTSCIMLG
ncbi:K(lysine) acetyltransferase [Geranomyces variabilis]|nr:K(lysine) acetyltransferase [Geranomyces variabilis]